MKYLILFTSILLMAFPAEVNDYMLGVDIGSEFFKICLVKPGKPFSIVENLQSKLKTPTSVSLKDDEIAYGSDALVKKSKFPKNIFTHFENYLGASYNDSFIQQFLNDFLVSYDIEENKNRHSIDFTINFNNEKYNIPIELIYGMLFDHIKFISEKYGGIEVTNVFVTIPSFFNYKQRNALAQGIELSKLRLDGFISEPLSAAVQFQLNRKFNKEEYYIIYDMGASYTQASLISYSEVKDENQTKVIGNRINVISEVWDKELGGKYFDKNLVKLMMDKFDKLPQRKGKESIKNNKKIFEKMLPHSVKCKEVLSSNKECYIAVLSVDKDMNLEGPITREEFIEVNSELFKKVYKPIQKLLTQNNLTINNLSGIELIGGSIRIPRVKEILEENLNENKTLLGVHMNGDDSMAYGAAYMAVNSSLNFRGRKKTYILNGANSQLKIYLSNYNVKEDQQYCTENAYDDTNSNIKKLNKDCIHFLEKQTVLIPFRYPFDSKKKITFHHDSDILIKVTERMINEEKENELMNFTITGIQKFTKKMIEINETNLPVINLQFFYTKGGKLELSATASYDEILYLGKHINPNGTEKVEWSRTISSPLTQKEIDEIDNILNTSTVLSRTDLLKQLEEQLKKNITNSTNQKDNNSSSFNDPKTKKNKTITEYERNELLLKKRIGETKNNTVKQRLSIKESYTYPKPLNSREMNELRNTIKKIYDIDKNRILLVEAKNSMESLIYKNKEFLETPFAKEIANESEYEITHKFIYNLSSWYDEDGIIAPLEVLEMELNRVAQHFYVYQNRMNIYEMRNKAIINFENELNNTLKKVMKLQSEKNWINEFVNETFYYVIQNITIDLSNKLQIQKTKKLYEDSVITANEINEQINNIHKAYYNLTRIKKPDQNMDVNLLFYELLRGSDNIDDLIKKSNITEDDYENIRNSLKTTSKNISDSHYNQTMNNSTNNKKHKSSKNKTEAKSDL